MIANDPFERTVSDWLHADAEHRVPDHLDAVLRRTSTERQRPAWSSLERWLSMDTTFNRRMAPSFQRLGPIVLAALLLLALLAVILVAGSRQSKLPAPFGPAGNGAVVYGAYNGDIYMFDPATGTSRPLITGPTTDGRPYFSRDGSQLVFARAAAAPGLYELTIARADGTIVRSLTRPIHPGGIDWSPDGTRLAVVDSSPNTFSILSVDGTETRDINLRLKADQIFWRPDGKELVFRGVSSGSGPETPGLYAVRPDGTELREIVPPTPDAELQEPALSPDGTQVMYTTWDADSIPGGQLYVVGVDGGGPQMLVFDGALESDYFGEWSPDGSQVVLNQGTAQETYRLAVGPAGGGQVVNIGPELAWDAAAQTAFSPDGSKVIARYGNGSTWILDVNGGPGERLKIATPELLSWQRVAR